MRKVKIEIMPVVYCSYEREYVSVGKCSTCRFNNGFETMAVFCNDPYYEKEEEEQC